MELFLPAGEEEEALTHTDSNEGVLVSLVRPSASAHAQKLHTNKYKSSWDLASVR